MCGNEGDIGTNELTNVLIQDDIFMNLIKWTELQQIIIKKILKVPFWCFWGTKIITCITTWKIFSKNFQPLNFCGSLISEFSSSLDSLCESTRNQNRLSFQVTGFVIRNLFFRVIGAAPLVQF